VRRRSTIGRTTPKARHNKTKKPNRSDCAKVALDRGLPAASQATEIARLTSELNEASEQQTATSEVLQVISRSPGDLEPVFATMMEKAVRICGASFGNIYRWDGQALNIVASHNSAAAFVEQRRQEPFRPSPINPVGQMIASKKTVHVHDMAETQAYLSGDPVAVASVNIMGARTGLAVPMLKDNELIGAFTLGRQEVRDYSERQIALVTNFANQAVIAIENARLLNELRQRTADLTEALEQQTASAEVLRIISSSPGELEPVFQAILENAIRLCEAKCGALYRFDALHFSFAAEVGTQPELADFQRQRGPFLPPENSLLDRVMQTKQVGHTADNAADPVPGPLTRLGGSRSIVIVPMLRDDQLIGTFHVYRQEVRPFTDKQIALVQNFADQAVIAIENARLLNELRHSLEQQTATADILRVISQSPTDARPVFDSIVATAVRLLGSDQVAVMFRDRDVFSVVAAATPEGPVATLASRKMCRSMPARTFLARDRRWTNAASAGLVADRPAGI